MPDIISTNHDKKKAKEEKVLLRKRSRKQETGRQIEWAVLTSWGNSLLTERLRVSGKDKLIYEDKTPVGLSLSS